MNPEPLFIGVSRAAPPAGGVVRLLAATREVSTRELPSIPGPKVILGGPPCDHWAKAVRERPDTLYVVVGEAAAPLRAGNGATPLPSAPLGQLRRYFARLLELKQRYGGGLPEVAESEFAWKGHRVALTTTEAALLQRLLGCEGSIVGREELARIAGVSSAPSRALDAHIHRLRQKLAVPGVELRTERQRGFGLVLS